MIEWALHNPLFALIIVLATLWAFERMVNNFFNRNKPAVDCKCDCCYEEDEDERDDEPNGRQ